MKKLISAKQFHPRGTRSYGMLRCRYPSAHEFRPTFSNRANQGIAECEQALALDHNLANAHAIIGLAKYFLGRGEETEAHVHEALRLSPRNIFAFRWMMWSESPRAAECRHGSVRLAPAQH